MNMNMVEQIPFSEKYPVFRKLAEIGDLRKLSREELELYDEDIKNMRDIYMQVATATELPLEEIQKMKE